MSSVQKLCNRGILLNTGLIDLIGGIEEVVDKYLVSNSSSEAVYEIPEPKNLQQNIGYAYRLQVENFKGNLVNEIAVGQPWQIRVLFKLTKPVKHFIIGIGLTNAAAVDVRTSWSKELDYEAGDYEVVFREDKLLLAVGYYYITIGLSSYERTFHFVEKGASINISDASSATLDRSIIRTSGTGLILNPMEIQISKRVENII